MKKIFFIITMLIISTTIFGQHEKLVKAIEVKLIAVDTAQNVSDLIDMANYFDRISKSEEKEWLPLYYKAFAHIKIGFIYNTTGKLDLIDAQADEAEKCLDKLEAMIKPNSETYCLRKMVASMRIVADPYSRFPSYAPVSDAAIATAKELNPENPRVYLLLALDKYNIPEQFGGSKPAAKELLEVAITKFKLFKPETQAGPQWGLAQAQYFHSLIK